MNSMPLYFLVQSLLVYSNAFDILSLSNTPECGNEGWAKVYSQKTSNGGFPTSLSCSTTQCSHWTMFTTDSLKFDNFDQYKAEDGAIAFTMVWDDEYYIQWEQGENPVEVSADSPNTWKTSAYYYTLTVSDEMNQYGQMDFNGLGRSADAGIMFDGRCSSGAWFAIGVSTQMQLIDFDDGIPGFISISGYNYTADLVELYVWLPECGDWTRQAEPSDAPTFVPTSIPTKSMAPTQWPTQHPTPAPTYAPTFSPTPAPSDAPTEAPSPRPTLAPTPGPTNVPSNNPTGMPTHSPTFSPTTSPTVRPTDFPSNTPTVSPTQVPTPNPSDIPTEAPTPIPTESPTNDPSPSPTYNPTGVPTKPPTISPSPSPSVSPSRQPTESPTDPPSAAPTIPPTTSKPSLSPTENPTAKPTTPDPTHSPTNHPTDHPTYSPTFQPTDKPTITPTGRPTSETDLLIAKDQNMSLIIITVVALLLFVIFIIFTCWLFMTKRVPRFSICEGSRGKSRKKRSYKDKRCETDSESDSERHKKKRKNQSNRIELIVKTGSSTNYPRIKGGDNNMLNRTRGETDSSFTDGASTYKIKTAGQRHYSKRGQKSSGPKLLWSAKCRSAPSHSIQEESSGSAQDSIIGSSLILQDPPIPSPNKKTYASTGKNPLSEYLTPRDTIDSQGGEFYEARETRQVSDRVFISPKKTHYTKELQIVGSSSSEYSKEGENSTSDLQEDSVLKDLPTKAVSSHLDSNRNFKASRDGEKSPISIKHNQLTTPGEDLARRRTSAGLRSLGIADSFNPEPIWATGEVAEENFVFDSEFQPESGSKHWSYENKGAEDEVDNANKYINKTASLSKEPLK